MDSKILLNGIDLSDFFLKGFVILEEQGLNETHNITDYLGKKYIEELFGDWELKEFTESFEVLKEDRITVWHNDFKLVGANLTFLYYMDDMSPEIGGSISIKNGLFEEKIYPKKGMLIMLSQKQNVFHKVEFCSSRRRMYNIDYYVQRF